MTTAPRLTCLLVALGLVVGGSTAASAADTDPPTGGSLTWGIAPASPDGPDGRSTIQVLGEPGQEYQETVVISNYGDQTLNLTLGAADAITTPDGGFDLTVDEPDDAGAWIALETDLITLAPREARLVETTVTIPPDAEPGDHAAGIIATLGSTAEEGIAVERRVGVRTFVRVMGPVTAAFDIENLDTSYRHSYLPFAPGDGTATFEVVNSGNIRLSGTPEVTLSGPFGLGARTVSADPIDEVLPGGRVSIDVDLRSFRPSGWHTVTVELTPAASAGQTLEAAGTATRSSRLWTIPYALLASIAIGLFVVATAVMRHRRSNLVRAQRAG